MTTPAPHTGRDRRRHGFVPRVARITWPARNAADEFLGAFPCNLIGHRWVEIPQSLRRSARSDGWRLRFACSRCSQQGGFTV